MPIEFACPSCKTTLKTSNPAFAGKMIRCPKCQTASRVPGGEKAEPARPAEKPAEKAAPRPAAVKSEEKPAPRARPTAKAQDEALTPARRPEPVLEDADDEAAPVKPRAKKAKGGSGLLILFVLSLLLMAVGAGIAFGLGDPESKVYGLMIAGAGLALLAIGFPLIVVWKLFTKAGEPGWASLVPIYSFFVLARICSRSPAFGLLYMIPCISPFILPFDLSSAFGKKTGFALGLLFFPIIFLPVLALGSAEHVRVQRGKPAKRKDYEDEDEEEEPRPSRAKGKKTKA